MWTKVKKTWLVVIIVFVISFLFLSDRCFAVDENSDPFLLVSDSNNTTVVDFQVLNVNTEIYDEAHVNGRLIYNDESTRTFNKIVTKEFIIVKDNQLFFSVDFSNYGKFDVDVELYKGGVRYISFSTQSVAITADVYNIAPLVASMPVSYFSLDLWGENTFRKEGPSIVQLERGKQYDWDYLPKDNFSEQDRVYGVYGCPYTPESLLRQGVNLNDMYLYINDYVRDLLSLNPYSKINFHTNDLSCGLINSIIYVNNVQNYTIKMYSDGALTSEITSKFFNGSSFYENMNILNNAIFDWNNQKAQAQATGQPTYDGINFHARLCPYLILEVENNVEWIVNNKSYIKTTFDNDEFGNYIRQNSKLMAVSLNELLEKNIKVSYTATEELKLLYKFSNDYFERAKKEGKPVLLFLGISNEKNTLEDYLRIVKSYYGDAYCYYYKGHPATPTSSDYKKQIILNNIDVEDIDSSIPCEIILFFNPEIFVCGFSSSSLLSISAGKDLAMARMTKQEGLESAYGCCHYCDFWSSEIGESTPVQIQTLTEPGINYLVEFNDDICTTQNFDIAIFNSSKSTLKYYKYQEGSYIFVKSQDCIRPYCDINVGTYYISSCVDQRKLFDVEGASLDNTANVLLWEWNNALNQQWKLDVDNQGWFILVNVNSGKCLDIEGGRAFDNANLCQYEQNGGDNQKWMIIKDDDKYMLSSKLDKNLVVDIEGGLLSNGTNIIVYSANGDDNQYFKFWSEEPQVEKSSCDITDGEYKICSVLDRDKLIDIEGSSSQDGANVCLWSDNGGANQVFNIELLPNGYHKIVCKSSNKALDVEAGVVLPGTNVLQWQDDAYYNKNQQWSIRKLASGGYIFQNVATGLYMDITGACIDDGTNICAYSLNGDYNQIFDFIS